jgi:hypothetical protein
MSQVVRACKALALLIVSAALFLIPSPAPTFALSSPCSFDPNNLIYNGSMREGQLSQWGPVSDGWNAFVLSGSPSFNWVDNEGIDPNGSQYISSDSQFDAGIYQVVQNLQQGEYYHFWVGYGLAAYDNGDTVNRRYDQIGRMVGVDPTGGTDPRSPAIMWGKEALNGKAAVNIAALSATFPAQADHVTVYVRAINHSNQYLNKVWFDAICMEARPDLPTATPLASATATLAPTDTPRPTRPPVVVIPATSMPTDTETVAPTDTDTPTITNTPTPSTTPSETPKPRRSIPAASPPATSGRTDALPIALFFGSLGIVLLSLIGIFGLVAFVVWQMSKHRARGKRRLPPFAFPQVYDEMEEFNEAIEPRIPPDEQLPGDIF